MVRFLGLSMPTEPHELTGGVPPLGSELRDALACHRAEARTMLEHPGADGVALGRRNAEILDGLMTTMFAAAHGSLGQPRQAIALAAVGSYGRGAVALKSDADVRLIVPNARGRNREEASAFVEALLYPLWDVGLSIGHQVMEPDEALALAHEDLATATTLLDLRYLAGGKTLVSELLDRAWNGMFLESAIGEFIDRLDAEASGRQARLGGSLYLLEPDVKGGSGGLRDLDGVRWVARARYRVGDPGDPQSIWRELVRLGVFVGRESQEITEAETFLWRVRNRLHAHADRKSDRLTFDEQETIALEMGYVEANSGNDDARAAGAERLMQDYYLHARIVTRAKERMFERARPPRKRSRMADADLGHGVRLFDGHVTLAGSAELLSDPPLALRVYAACARHDAPVLPFAREVIARATSDPAFAAALRASREANDLFADLICTVAESRMPRGSIAGELHDVGLLLAMIPEFLPVTGRVHHDTYHVYTVDVHSVAALDCLRSLARGELAPVHPLASRLAAEIARPRPLFLATLLHDVGKGYPDANGSRKNHSQSGAELCDRILPRLGLSEEDVAEARALVAQHLSMYHVATRRDLDDPTTIQDFCVGVRGREGLRDLYLLTVADITTTSPTAMTSWKSRMLEELYLASDGFLLGGRPSQIDEERLGRVRDAAARLWSGERSALDAFVGSMPERYLLANTPDAIVAHAQVALDRKSSPVHAALVPSKHPEFSELCVIAEDRPGLLARIAAAITAGRLEVLAAQVYSRVLPGGRTEAVDLFWVRNRAEATPEARRFARFLKDLDDVCSGAVDPADLLRARTGSASPWRERPSPAITTEVVVDDRASPRHTVIEVFAKDRPGLLYTLARALHELGLTIALSKINTEGTKVADVFYVSELDGTKVVPGERFKVIRDALTGAIGCNGDP